MSRVKISLIQGVILFLLHAVGYAQEYKIGVVDLIRVLESSPQAEVARKQIEKEFAPLQDEVISFQKALKELETKLSKDGAIMKDSERNTLERDIISRRREIDRKQEEYKEDLGYRKNEELSKIQRDIVEAIQAIAKEKDYHLILNRESLPYASADTDVTDQVLEKLAQTPSAARESSAKDKE